LIDCLQNTTLRKRLAQGALADFKERIVSKTFSNCAWSFSLGRQGRN